MDIGGRDKYLPTMIEGFLRSRKVAAITVVDFEGKVILSSMGRPPDYLRVTRLLSSLEAGRSRLELSAERQRIIFIEPIFYYQTPQGAVVMEVELGAFAAQAVNPQKKFRYRLLRGQQVVWESQSQDQQGEFLTVQHGFSPNQTHLQQLGFSLEIGTLKASYRGLVGTVIAQLSLLGLVFIALSAVLAVRIANRIARPVLTLCERVRGSDIWVETTPVPLETHQELEELAEAFDQRTRSLRQEMAQRERAEQDLLFTQFVIDHSADAALWAGPDGSFAYVNKAACELLGYSREEFLAMSVADIDPNLPAEAWASHWREMQEKKFAIDESQLRAKDDSSGPVEVAINHVCFKDKAFNCAFVRDISDRIKSEQERAVLEHQLRQSQKMEAIGTLAGGIAHDFNNVLSPILGYAELVQAMVPASGPAADGLKAISKAALRAKELVQQILMFSRRSAHERKPLLPHAVVKESLMLLRHSLPTTIEIREDISIDCGMILGDPTQLQQIIMNLGTNAFHAMREKGGVLGITLRQVDIAAGDLKVAGQEMAAGPYVMIEVSDTGCGMDRETMAKIFEPYFTTKKRGRHRIGVWPSSMGSSRATTATSPFTASLVRERPFMSTCRSWLPSRPRRRPTAPHLGRSLTAAKGCSSWTTRRRSPACCPMC